MRDRVLLLVSVVLNTVLAAVLVAHLVDSRPKVRRVTRTIRLPASVTNLVRTNFTITQMNFEWSMLESEDYVTYIQNLRAVGCPEETVRDIIVADVDKIFSGRRAQEPPAEDIEWWRADPHAGRNKAREERHAALETERQEMLARLLGPDWARGAEVGDAGNSMLTGPVLSALPPETKKALHDIDARGAQRMTDLLEAAEKSGREVDAAEEVRLRRQTREELARVLTPLQLEEFLIRNSDNANRIRSELGHFEPTADEFRALFRASDPFDLKIQADHSGEDAISRQARAQLEQQRANSLKQALGPQRYEEFKLNQEPGYREVFGALQNSGAPPESARAVHQINQATQQEIERVRGMQNLNDEQQKNLIAAAEAERDRTLKGFLGEDAFGKFTEQRQVQGLDSTVPVNMLFDARGKMQVGGEWLFKAPADVSFRQRPQGVRPLNGESERRIFFDYSGSLPDRKKSP